MADEVQPKQDAASGEQPASRPARPPASGSGGTPPMTPTRMRLGTGRGGAGGGTRPPQPPRPTAAAGPPEGEGSEPPARPVAESEAAAAGAEVQPPVRQAPPTREPGAPEPARPTGAPAPPAADTAPAGETAAQVSGARPAAQRAPAPARPAAAPPARPAAAAGATAAPARTATAARPAPSGAAAATTERLAAAVSREPAAGGGAQAEKLVYVWPHLVTIEFIAAVLMLLSMVVLSWLVNAPLEAHANPDRTPNPSKAPWYFLNLQELLLHMHPALAGVIVPSAALGLIAAIPYLDRDQTDVGKWFGTRNAIPITIFVSIYTTIVEVALIFFDEYIGVKPMMEAIARATGINYFREQAPFGIAALSMPNTIVPTFLMLFPILPMMWFIHRRWKPSTREVMIALFTGFFVSYIILTIFGTFFRGQGMHLYWPWDPGMIRIE